MSIADEEQRDCCEMHSKNDEDCTLWPQSTQAGSCLYAVARNLQAARSYGCVSKAHLEQPRLQQRIWDGRTCERVDRCGRLRRPAAPALQWARYQERVTPRLHPAPLPQSSAQLHQRFTRPGLRPRWHAADRGRFINDWHVHRPEVITLRLCCASITELPQTNESTMCRVHFQIETGG